jgi:Lipocalin-like domain
MSRKAATNQCVTSGRSGCHGHLVAVAIVVSIALSAPTATAGGKKPEQAFLGSWRLETFERKTDAGETTYPYGKHPVGRLSYDTQGRMSVLIMGPDRTRFKAETSAAGTTEEKAAAFDTFVAYAGTYRVDETSHTIVHGIDITSYPNFEGSDSVEHTHSLVAS